MQPERMERTATPNPVFISALSALKREKNEAFLLGSGFLSVADSLLFFPPVSFQTDYSCFLFSFLSGRWLYRYVWDDERHDWKHGKNPP